MRFEYFASLLLAIFLLTATATAQSEAATLVTFREPTSLQVVADGESRSLKFPAAYADKVEPTSIKLAVETIVRDGVQDDAFQSLFDARWDGDTAAAAVKVTLSGTPRPGSYRIGLRLDGLIDAQSATQSQQLTVVIPAAGVRSLGTVTIARTISWPGSSSVRGRTLQLQETSRVSRMTGVAVRQLSLSALDGPAVNSKVLFKGIPESIPPGRVASLDAELEGEFPLGTATGKLEVSATELTQPYELDFKVESTHTKWALLLPIFIGLVIAYLLKTQVALVSALSEARIQAADVLHRLENPDYPDSQFCKALALPRENLRTAIAGDDPQAISTGKAQGEKAIADAIEKLNVRRTEAQAALMEFDKTVRGRWSVDGTIREILHKAAEECENAKTQLNDGDVAAAEGVLTKSREATLAETQDALQLWISKLNDLFSQYPNKQPPLSLSVRKSETELERLKTALDSLESEQTADDLRALLDAVSAYRRRLYRFLEGEVHGIASLVRYVLHEAADRVNPVSVDGHIKALREALTPFDVEKVFDATISHNDAIHNALTRVMEEAADPTAKDQVRKRMSAGEYEAAVQELMSVSTSAPDEIQPASPAVSGRPAIRPFGTKAAGHDMVRAEEKVDGTASLVMWTVSALRAPPTAKTIRVQARQSLIRAKLLNSAISGVLAIVAGYFVFQESFVGNKEDYAAAFVWALGVDAGIEGVMATLRSKLGVSSQ